MKRTKLFWTVLLATSYLFISSSSWGQEKYPSRPITLLNPMGPGGGNDIISRFLSSVAYDYLGQPLVVTMKTGAGGVIGTAFAARAKPDGYTLLIGGTGPNSITPQIEDTGYTKDDFIPIVKITHLAVVVAVRADKPWKTLDDLLNHIRENPEKVRFGTTAVKGITGLSNHLLLRSAGIKTSLPTVPFKGVGDQVLSILKGDTDYMVQVYLGLMSFIKSKEIRVLAVLDEKRSPLWPDVPTAKELGYDVVSNMWMTILAPKGTPGEVVEKLSPAFDKIAKDPSFVAMMEKIEVPIFFEDRAKFQNYWDEEYKQYGDLINLLNLKKK